MGVNIKQHSLFCGPKEGRNTGLLNGTRECRITGVSGQRGVRIRAFERGFRTWGASDHRDVG